MYSADEIFTGNSPNSGTYPCCSDESTAQQLGLGTFKTFQLWVDLRGQGFKGGPLTTLGWFKVLAGL